AADEQGLRLSGPTRPVVDGQLRDAGALPPPPAVDVLWADTLCLGTPPSVTGEAEHTARQRLVAAGLADTTAKSLFAHTEQLLLGAAPPRPPIKRRGAEA